MKNKDKCLTQEEISDLKQAFELFVNESTGKIDFKEIHEAMKCLNIQTKSPAVYELIQNLDTEDNSIKGGVDFEQFIDAINDKLTKHETSGMKRMFDLFKDNEQSNTISIDAIKSIFQDIGDTMSEQDVEEMLKKITSNSNEITFDEFVEIMTRSTFN